MAARKQITDQSEHEDPPILDAGYEDVSGLIDAQEKMENEINAEIGTPDGDVRWMIKVYRVEPNGKELTYLFQIVGESIEGMSDRLRDEYGSGKYMVRVYKNGVLKKSPVLKVEAPKNKAPTVISDARNDALVALVQQLGASQQALLQQVATLKAAPPVAPSPVDPVGMFTGMASMMKAMRDFMPAPPQPESPMKMITEVVTMAKELSDTGREKGMFDILSDVLQSPLFAKAVEGAQPAGQPQLQQRQIPQTPRPQIQSPAASVAAPAQPADTPPASAGDEAKFAALLEMLVTRAANNSDPVLYADFIEDMVDRSALETLLALPDPVGALVQYNPAVATYRVWFAQLFEALTQPPEGVDEEGALGQTADTPLASGNAPAPVPSAVTP